jgi:glycosyltransferase involved in cell wall biosynthesis
MRVLFVVHKFPPQSVGGVETYTWSLARALAEAGHEAFVFYPVIGLDAAEARSEEGGIHRWAVSLPETRGHEGALQQFWHTFRDVGLEARFQKCLAEVRPDIVHFQHVQGLSARLLALASGWHRLVTLHDYWFFCANSQLLRPDGQMCAGPQWGWNCVDCLTVRADLHWMRALRPLVALPLAYRNAYLRRMARSVPVFLAPSEFLRQQYVHQGFPGERITVIDLGLDMQRLAEVADSTLPAPAARPHFGFLGALAPHKGVHMLVHAFNQLPANAALTIYGSETTSPGYVAQLKAMATHPHIRFAGAVDYHHVGVALRQLDCLVVPSIWYENSPMVIQEAYGCKIPVVASRLGALPEKVRDGETGRLFAPGDSADLARVLRELIEQPEQLAALRASIKPGPTIQQHAQQMLEIYQAACSAGL